MIVALLAGLWPGLLAMVTAAIMIFVFWLIPGREPLFHIGTSNFVGLALFMVVCGFLTGVAELYRRSRQKAAAYDKEQAQRQAQEALRQQAELLKLSFDAIIVWRVGGGIESWNRGAEELYGYSEQEARGRSLNELLKAPRAGPLAGRWKTRCARNGEWFGEIEHTTKNGRVVTVSSRQLFGRGLDGSERVLEIDRDITDSKRVEEELRRAHDDLEEKVELRTADLQTANRTLLMVSACDQALVQISDERELTGVICQIIQDEGGYGLVWVGLPESRAQESIRCVSSVGDRNGYLESLEKAGGDTALSSGPAGRAIRTKSPVVCLDVAGSTEESVWKEMTLSCGFQAVAAFPLLDLQKNVLGVLVISSNSVSGFEQRQVSLLKELADDLAFGIASLRARGERDQAQRALELKATQLQALAGEIVRTEQRERQRIAQLLHDQIQQLLVATLYGLEGLLEEKPTVEYRQSAKKLSDLVRECISMSRSLMSELSHPSYTEPDLYTALGWLGAWVKEKHGLEVKVQCAQPIAARCRGDPGHAAAVRAGAPLQRGEAFGSQGGHRRALAGARRIRAGDGERRGSRLRPGKCPSHGTHFWRLRIVQRARAARCHWRRDEDRKCPGKGSRVSVWIPADASVVLESARPSGKTPARQVTPAESIPDLPDAKDVPRFPVARRGAAGKIRVLLVDDHAVVRNGIALQLVQQPDIEIVGEAADGTMALDLVRALRPDVVTMDVNMPGMNGIEAARAIHAEVPDTRIIGLSMSEESEQGAAMRSAGAVRYLSKSASLESLLAAIRGFATEA